MKKTHETIFIAVVGILFFAIAIVFAFFPRSTYSEVERRELAKFPDFSFQALKSGEFFKQVGSWFSDSEPYRDVFMAAHMSIKDKMGIKAGGEENIRFHAAEPAAGSASADDDAQGNAVAEIDEGNVRIGHAGIIVTGEGSKVRAIMNFKGSSTCRSPYARLLNEIKKEMPELNVYACVIPTSIAFYAPEKVKNPSNDLKAVIDNMYNQLDSGIRKVDVLGALDKHKGEDIYLRTDHHWSPLGGYYAAREIARVAGVPSRSLSEYDRKVIHGFVGTMYGYSKDISVKNSPEDFVYYTPKDSSYVTYYTNFSINKDFQVTGEGPTVRGPFFYTFKDGSGMAYSTMMGGDSKITKVVTGTKSPRKVAIIKDSFGNALPAYLFGSFAEVHVLDYRYFPRNLKKYIADNGITDLVIGVNVFSAFSDGICDRIRKMLTQPNHLVPPTPKKDAPAAPAKSATPKSEDPAPTPKPAEAPAPPAEAPASPAEPEAPAL